MKKIAFLLVVLALTTLVVGCASDSSDDTDTGGTTPPPDAGVAALIDNFDDGDDEMLTNDFRPNGPEMLGYWYYFTDGSAGESNMVESDSASGIGSNIGTPPSIAAPGRSGAATDLAIHWVSKTPYTEWGAGFGIDLNTDGCIEDDAGVDEGDAGVKQAAAKCPIDLSMYNGLIFWAKGTGTISAAVQQLNTVSTAEGGTCEEEEPVVDNLYCSNGFGKYAIELTDTWTAYALPFKGENVVAQDEGWGIAEIFDPTTIVGFMIQTGLTPSTYDIWVDDIYLY